MTAKSKRRMTSFNYMLVPDDLSEELSAALSQQASELEEIYHSAISQVKKIDSSDEFTARGRQRKKRSLMGQIEEAVEKHVRTATKPMQHMGGPSIALEIQQLKAELQPQQTGEDPTLAFLKLQEIRNLLRGLDPNKRELEIRAQAARGNYSYLLAATTAPEGSQSFILDKSLEELTQRRIVDQNPAAAARIEVLELAQSRLLGMLGSFKAALKKAGIEEEQPDTVALLAGSG